MELQVRTFGPFKMPKNFALELRIGNWVSHFYVLGIPGQPIESPEIKKVRVDVELLKHIYDNGMLACYQGIPLTPEILEKAGLVLDWTEGENERWSNNEIELWGNAAKGFLLLNGEECTHWRFSYKYVHQLQNLYFVLTGTELTIEL